MHSEVVETITLLAKKKAIHNQFDFLFAIIIESILVAMTTDTA
jgi:hypothetical protein